MANDIIDINVYETTETVSITVNPNLTTVNINKVTSSSGSGTTNLSTTQTASNFTINSDTGDDAVVPLGNGTLAGATLNNYTTAEKTKLSNISGTNTGDQNLQSVTDIGATTTNTININPFDDEASALIANKNGVPTGVVQIYSNGYNENSKALYINAGNSSAIYATSNYNEIIGDNYNNTILCQNLSAKSTASGLYIQSPDATAIRSYSSTGIGEEINLGSSAKGIIINSGTSSTGVPFAINKNGVDKLTINQQGELTAEKLIKSGGTSSQILAANGSVITAGTNITISGGTISSTGVNSPITIVNGNSLFSTGLTGTGTGATGATNSIFLGQNAGNGATNAEASNFFGTQAGSLATNANNSNFLGAGAGYGASSAGQSNFLGTNAGFGAEIAESSNFFGLVAGYLATGAN